MFVKFLFLATPRIVAVMTSGAFENPNSQCRAGAQRSQESPPGSPQSCVGLGGLVVGVKSKISISCFGFLKTKKKKNNHPLSSEILNRNCTEKIYLWNLRLGNRKNLCRHHNRIRGLNVHGGRTSARITSANSPFGQSCPIDFQGVNC